MGATLSTRRAICVMKESRCCRELEACEQDALDTTVCQDTHRPLTIPSNVPKMQRLNTMERVCSPQAACNSVALPGVLISSRTVYAKTQ